MSVTLPILGTVEAPVSTVLTTTSATDVFTAAAQYSQKIIAISLANEDTSNDIKVTLDWNDGSTDFTFMVSEVPAEKTAILADLPLLLTSKVATQKIKATAATANQITVTVIAVADLAQQGRSV